MDLEAGREHLESILLGTHSAVAAGLPVEDLGAIGPTECVDRLNRGLDTFLYRLSYSVQVGSDSEGRRLLNDVEAHWTERGFILDRSRLDDPQPELLARSDTFRFRVLAVPGSGVLNLAGDTPCLEPLRPS